MSKYFRFLATWSDGEAHVIRDTRLANAEQCARFRMTEAGVTLVSVVRIVEHRRGRSVADLAGRVARELVDARTECAPDDPGASGGAEAIHE